jgi:hypothetical protein
MKSAIIQTVSVVCVVFPTMRRPRLEAGKIARQIATGDTTAASMKNSHAASFGRAIELLQPTGISLELAAAHYAEA